MNKTNFDNISETLYSTVLDNGLTIYAIEKPEFSCSYASFSTSYGGAMRRFSVEGEMFDTPAGIAHFLEHKMFDMPEGDNALTALSKNGASPNAWTSDSMTNYYFECTESFEENLRLLLNFVSTPYFTKESVDKEQGIIAQEIRMIEDNPDFRLYYEFLKCLFEKNPVRDSVAGTVESISEITHETLHALFSTFYVPSNMVLCVMGGSVNFDEVVKIAKEILPTEKMPVPVSDFGADEGLLPFNKSFSCEMEVSAPQLFAGAKFTPAVDANERLRQELVARLALRTFMGRSSKFYTGLYAKGLISSDFAYDVTYSSGAAWIEFAGETNDYEAVLAEVKSASQQLKKSGLDKDLFMRVKRASYGSKLRALQSFDTVCVDLARGHFAGFCSLDAYEVLDTITKEECEKFLLDVFQAERLAYALINPISRGV